MFRAICSQQVFSCFRSTLVRAIVRQVALELSSLHGEAANAFWRKTARDLYSDLIGSGQDEARAREDVGRFSAAVQAELCSGIEPSLSLVTA